MPAGARIVSAATSHCPDETNPPANAIAAKTRSPCGPLRHANVKSSLSQFGRPPVLFQFSSTVHRAHEMRPHQGMNINTRLRRPEHDSKDALFSGCLKSVKCGVERRFVDRQ